MTEPRTDLGPQSCVQGDPFSWTITINSTSSGGVVTPVNLTTFGSVWTAMLRQNPAQTPPVAFGINTSSASTGVLVLSLTGTQTAAMATGPADPTVWFFDLQVSGGSVTPLTPYRGSLTVWKVFTHA